MVFIHGLDHVSQMAYSTARFLVIATTQPLNGWLSKKERQSAFLVLKIVQIFLSMQNVLDLHLDLLVRVLS